MRGPAENGARVVFAPTDLQDTDGKPQGWMQSFLKTAGLPSEATAATAVRKKLLLVFPRFCYLYPH